MTHLSPNQPATSGSGDEAVQQDHELLMRVQDRDEAALTVLYDRYSGLVFTLALRMAGIDNWRRKCSRTRSGDAGTGPSSLTWLAAESAGG